MTKDKGASLKSIRIHGFQIDEANETVQDGDYRLYEGLFEMEGVAEDITDETGMLDSMPEHLKIYFGYEAFGRDMAIEGTFIWSNQGIISLW